MLMETRHPVLPTVGDMARTDSYVAKSIDDDVSLILLHVSDSVSGLFTTGSMKETTYVSTFGNCPGTIVLVKGCEIVKTSMTVSHQLCCRSMCIQLWTLPQAR